MFGFGIQLNKLKQFKGLLNRHVGATAAYSLRKLSSTYYGPVVRVRRESDSAERDFTAQDINTSVVENWVNQQIIPPLDLRELTPTGRDGPLIPAAAAYSLRNLSNSYTGNVVKVRRSSDDAEADFTAVEVSDGTLLAWVGTGGTDNGFVTTWYDQSGNANHATQATPANQPKVVDAGVLVAGGIDFDGVDDYFDLDLGADLAQPNSFFMSQTSDTTSSAFNEFFDSTSGSPRTLLDVGTGYRLTAGVDLDDASFTMETNRVLFSAFANSTSSFICKNGVPSAVGDAGTEDVNQFSSVGRSGIRYYNGKMDEFIIYNSDQSDNRTAFEANIGEVYGIAGIPAYDNTVNGFVETWYDQSGNGNNASQLTASQQPKIVDTGVLVLSNGNAAIKSTASNSMSFSMASLSADGQQSVFGVLENDVTSQDNYTSAFLALSNSDGSNGFNRRPYWYTAPNGSLFFSVDSLGGYNNSDRDRRLYSHIMEDTAGGTSTVYQDGTQVDTRSITLDANPNFISAQVGSVGTNAVGALYTSELIYYPSDQSASRVAIEGNIASHYDIPVIIDIPVFIAVFYENAVGDVFVNAAGNTFQQP